MPSAARSPRCPGRSASTGTAARPSGHANLVWGPERIPGLGLGIRPFDTYLDAGQPAGFDLATRFLRVRGSELR
jgi:hypothetical protein